eukprot:TRINITY_DN8421_c0_g1_i2.p1 TRINITY_DN8421_c0_g1~~TRINITY_DN8421_c0_g1_i2.p1  ORF type:complete len:786 (-),score=181.26 TRINITY_DN8421_c0_g1_i2:86-2413(-)
MTNTTPSVHVPLLLSPGAATIWRLRLFKIPLTLVVTVVALNLRRHGHVGEEGSGPEFGTGVGEHALMTSNRGGAAAATSMKQRRKRRGKAKRRNAQPARLVRVVNQVSEEEFRQSDHQMEGAQFRTAKIARGGIGAQSSANHPWWHTLVSDDSGALLDGSMVDAMKRQEATDAGKAGILIEENAAVFEGGSPAQTQQESATIEEQQETGQEEEAKEEKEEKEETETKGEEESDDEQAAAAAAEFMQAQREVTEAHEAVAGAAEERDAQQELTEENDVAASEEEKTHAQTELTGNDREEVEDMAKEHREALLGEYVQQRHTDGDSDAVLSKQKAAESEEEGRQSDAQDEESEAKKNEESEPDQNHDGHTEDLEEPSAEGEFQEDSNSVDSTTVVASTVSLAPVLTDPEDASSVDSTTAVASTASLAPVLPDPEDASSLDSTTAVASTASLAPVLTDPEVTSSVVSTTAFMSTVSLAPVLTAPEENRCPSMFVAVLSKPGNGDLRASIRNMWRSVGADWGDVQARFALCGATEETLLENETFGDLLFMNCTEGYTTGKLTRKVAKTMRIYYDQFSQQYKLYMKIDDDTFISARRICNILEWRAKHGKPNYRIYAGVFAEGPNETLKTNHSPSRDPTTPWYEPMDIFPDEFYPPSAKGGPGYILARPLVKRILDLGLDNRYLLHNEDKAVGVWVDKLVRSGDGIDMVNIPGTDGYNEHAGHIVTNGSYKLYPHFLHHHLAGNVIRCLHALDSTQEPERTVDECFRNPDHASVPLLEDW